MSIKDRRKYVKELKKEFSKSKIKTCRRCLKQYLKTHKCEVKETEQEAVKRSGRY